MLIDIRSLLVSGTLLNFLFLILSVLTWQRGRHHVGGPGYWLVGYGCFVLGILLVALRGVASDLVSIVLANLIISGGLALKMYGLSVCLSAPNRRIVRLLVAWVGLSGFLMAFFLYGIPSLAVRMKINSVFNGVLGAGAMWYLFRQPKTDVRDHSWPLLICFGGVSLLFVFRFGRAFFWTAGPSWLTANDVIESWLMMVLLALIAGIAVGEMVLLHGHMQAKLRTFSHDLASSNQRLRSEVQRRSMAEEALLAMNAELGCTQKEILLTLAEVVEFRSKETALHVARVAEYARILGNALKLPDDEVRLLADAAPMHDIGKIAIPDEILMKPDVLTPAEMDIVRSHTIVGYNLLNKSERPLIRMAAVIAHEHHEQWDGGGYPLGKRGEGISVPGRVVCLCDVYDALSMDRPYKAAWELSEVVAFIREQGGHMFDPDVVHAFVETVDQFAQVTAELADGGCGF
ncbi:MAG: HD domain-containing protein [Spirochaetaceae bacterium]|nr:MAG: HD domain-containing protein [Spirochaetaceae bacterium]